jgi:hypothetical protein
MGPAWLSPGGQYLFPVPLSISNICISIGYLWPPGLPAVVATPLIVLCHSYLQHGDLRPVLEVIKGAWKG